MFEDSKIDLGVVDDVTVSWHPSLESTWTPHLSVFYQILKRLHKPWNIKTSFLGITSQHERTSTKVDEKVAAAAVSSVAPNSPFSYRQPLCNPMWLIRLKAPTNKVWQKEWNEAIIVSNMLHDILPKLSDKLITFCNTRKEDTVLNRLHIGLSYFTHSFLLKKKNSLLFV